MNEPAASRAGFVLDLERCVGCAACVVACRLENRWPSGAAWRRLVALNLRRRPAGPTYFLSVACHHCERPACLAACPSGAYRVRGDGAVIHDEARCLGCRYCEMACPFEAPRFDEEARVVRKCDFCRRRGERGETPACVAACPTEALSVWSGEEEPAGLVPGFADVARCAPRLRFIRPRTGRRRARFDALTQEAARLARRERGRS